MEVLSLFKQQTDTKNKISLIPVNRIMPNPYQPRKHFDTSALEELAASIKEYGIIQPISVRRIGINFELVAGERRLKAAQMAELEVVPCIVCEYSDNDSAIIALLENLQRQDLTFFEEAEGYYSLIKKHGLTQEMLARKIGKKQSTIANKLRLLKLPSDIKKIVVSHGLTERHARALLRIPDSGIQMSVVQEICSKDMTVQETDELVDKIIERFASGHYEEEEKPKANVKIYKDLRIFINTIKAAVDTMIKSGIEATSEKKEYEEYIEYVIKIPKKSA